MTDDEKKKRVKELARVRRKARELALFALYAYEQGGGELKKVLDDIALGEEAEDDVKRYAVKLADQTQTNIAAIDAMISDKAANWELRRMAAVDRNVLRFAAAELMYLGDAVPYKVVIDEAVEIAKTYGTDESGKFVNGILDSIRKDIYKKGNVKSGEEKTVNK